MDWNLKGDRNTRFFHVMATSRQTRNTINSITVGGVILEDPTSVKNEVWLHFSNLFKDDWKMRPTLKGEFKSSRLSTHFYVLEANFFEEEIWAAVLKGEILKFMQEFHASGSLIPGLNSSFITLVSKKENTLSLNEFRPISLIGSVYKILSKVLTNRLKSVMPLIIGDSQSAFLGGRNILDGVLIANEVMDSWECVSTTRISIIVNGCPTKEFNLQKRLRQDDSLLFCEGEISEVLNLKRILRCFEVASGLKINFHKSVICGIGISGSALAEFACLLNYKSQNLSIKYLGLPLDANPKRMKTWKPVVDKVKLRLAGWKRKLLSFAGRLTLVKAVLSSIPVYYLSLFKLPEGIAKELDKIQASFLWGGPDLKRKIHLVKWSEITKSIKQGSLGVRRIRDVNVCLLPKWWWRFASEPVSLW
ncbi:uncharacterized protein LOC114299137 [Camellia sinensis]|uniref:uncharacterized protein LOC114299137 n=1 Tax=Camellia sinensis TaxID=4442 RepID=UPI001035FC43|nr:uncharacterized protein LOC114299137 [Camellia sinensis]